MKDYCFWSIGDGKYAYILQALVFSFRHVGMKEDFHAISDRPIKGAVSHIVDSIDKNNFHFKVNFLMDLMRHLDYRYFIFFDADTYFLRKPQLNFLKLIKDDPLFAFRETDLTAANLKKHFWGKIPLTIYLNLMREKGVKTDKIYNLNGGFFIVKREAISEVCALIADFWEAGKQIGYELTDEPAISYSLHMLTNPSEEYLLRNFLNFWATDWLGTFANRVPYDKKWFYEDYFTFESYLANPDIIHAACSKNALEQIGKALS